MFYSKNHKCIKKNTKLIYISSTSVYGSNDKIMYENNKRNTLKPQSPYAVCKIKEENFLKTTQWFKLNLDSIMFIPILILISDNKL